MHPLIAFLSFIFSPTDDWLMKQAYEWMIDPSQVPAIVESYDRIQKQYPSLTGNQRETRYSADTVLISLWGDILYRQGYTKEALLVWNRLDDTPLLLPEFREELDLKLGEALLSNGDIDKSRIRFEKIAGSSQSGRVVDALTNLIVCDLVQGKKENAALRVKELLALVGENTPNRSLFPVGLSLFSENKFAEAAKFFARMEDDPRGLYFLGLSNRALNQTAAALTSWEKITKSHASGFWADLAHFQIAETYFAIGDDRLARLSYEGILKAHPQTPAAGQIQFRLASIDFRGGDYAGALAKLKPLTKDHELSERSTILMAESLVKTGGAEELMKAMAQRPANKNGMEGAYQKAWASAFSKRFDESVAQADYGLMRFNDKEFTPRILLLQGLAFEHSGHMPEALAAYQTVADRFPATLAAANGAHWTTLAYMRVGRLKEAATHGAYLWGQLSPKIQRAKPDTAFWLGEANLKLKRFDDAQKLYGSFINMAPRDNDLVPYAQFQRATALASSHESGQALALLDQFSRDAAAKKKDEWISLASLQRGNILYNDRRFPEAVLAYRASGNSPKALYQQGAALYRMDYFNDAVDAWTKLASLHHGTNYAEKGAFRAARTQFELGQTTACLAGFANFISSYPASAMVKPARLQMAQLLYNAGQSEGAAMFYADFLKRYNTNEDKASVTPYLASAYAQSGKPILEVEELMKGLPPADALGTMRWTEGAKLYNASSFSVSEHLFTGVMLETPANENASLAMFFRAEAMYQQKKWFDAEGAYGGYLTMRAQEDPEHVPLALFHKGVALFNQDKLLKAAKEFETLVKSYPDHALRSDAVTNLMMCYHNLGDWNSEDEMRNKYFRQASAAKDQVAKTPEPAADWAGQ